MNLLRYKGGAFWDRDLVVCGAVCPLTDLESMISLISFGGLFLPAYLCNFSSLTFSRFTSNLSIWSLTGRRKLDPFIRKLRMWRGGWFFFLSASRSSLSLCQWLLSRLIVMVWALSSFSYSSVGFSFFEARTRFNYSWRALASLFLRSSSVIWRTLFFT